MNCPICRNVLTRGAGQLAQPVFYCVHCASHIGFKVGTEEDPDELDETQYLFTPDEDKQNAAYEEFMIRVRGGIA